MWWEIVSSLISILLHTVGMSPIHIWHEASLCSLHHEVDITKELLVTCVQRYKAQPARGGGGCDMCLAYGGVRYKCVNISSIAVCWSDNTPYTVAGLSLADMNMIIITCPSPHTGGSPRSHTLDWPSSTQFIGIKVWNSLNIERVHLGNFETIKNISKVYFEIKRK